MKQPEEITIKGKATRKRALALGVILNGTTLEVSMNGNEPLIIALAIIGLPVLAVLYFLMPKDTHCNYCNSSLSMQRQKTYHVQLNGQEKEVCKRCYGKIIK